MKSQLVICLVIAIAFISNGQVSGQKIFLSPTGNDNNPGTYDKPLATLIAARNKAREYRKKSPVNQPVEIVAQAGEYSMLQPLELTIEDSGTPAAPLIFSPAAFRK